jgi:DNA-directed RNA polymerase subunit RPC12/RpoP
MSEFKFACPVCGQHITADSHASGTQLECPTCFQKIIVPQAPASPDSKFILSAAQVIKPRPTLTETATPWTPVRRSLASRLVPSLLGLLVVALAAGAAVYVFKRQLFNSATPQAQAKTNLPPKPAQPAPRPVYPIPTNIAWSLNLTNATFPETTPAGGIHGSGFRCERVTLQGGNLSFRQGKTWPPDLGLTLLLFAKQPEELSGKTIEVTSDRAPPLPRLILRWKDDQQQPAKEELTRGYALKLAFGQAANGRMPGQIFVCLPDESKSFIAGTFAAEIRRPPPAKPKTRQSPRAETPNPK